MNADVRVTKETRNGATVWVKRAAKDYRNGFQRVLFSLCFCQTQTAREAAAIRALAKRGAVVPRIVEERADVLVTEDIGVMLEQLIRGGTAEENQSLVVAAAQALEALHRAGGWHGNAALRNLTRTADGRIGMFDFEYGVPHCLPLTLKQAYDLWLLCSSAIGLDPTLRLAQAA